MAITQATKDNLKEHFKQKLYRAFPEMQPLEQNETAAARAIERFFAETAVRELFDKVREYEEKLEQLKEERDEVLQQIVQQLSSAARRAPASESYYYTRGVVAFGSSSALADALSRSFPQPLPAGVAGLVRNYVKYLYEAELQKIKDKYTAQEDLQNEILQGIALATSATKLEKKMDEWNARLQELIAAKNAPSRNKRNIKRRSRTDAADESCTA